MAANKYHISADLKKQIFEKCFSGKEVEDSKSPVIYVIAGGPGAGKNTLFEMLSRKGLIPVNAFISEPDEIMEMLPDYAVMKEVDPVAAFAKWQIPARELTNEMTEKARSNRMDIVYIRTLALADSTSFLKNIKQDGYKIILQAIYTHEDIAIERLAKREKEIKRHIDLDEAIRRAHLFAALWEEYVAMAAEITLYDNSGEIGDFRKVAQKLEGGLLEILDKNIYSKFQFS